MLAKHNPAEALPDLPSNVHLVDLSDYFCDATTCFPAAGNLMIYRDDNHITATYMRTLAPMLERELVGLLPMKKQPHSPQTLTAATEMSGPD
jgi:hypothetical protein